MSKARGNVVNPDEVVDAYGADSLRLYEMFMGPLEQVKPWSMRGVEGVYRFLSRVWRAVIDDRAEDTQLNPAVKDVPITMAPQESQDAIKEFGRPEYEQWIAGNPTELPLQPEKLVVAFRIWDEQVGAKIKK